MTEQKRNSDQAFDVVMEALDLAQDLSCEAMFCNPENLKRRFRWFGNRTLLAELVERQRRIEGYVEQAYKLTDKVSEWAREYQSDDKAGN